MGPSLSVCYDTDSTIVTGLDSHGKEIEDHVDFEAARLPPAPAAAIGSIISFQVMQA